MAVSYVKLLVVLTALYLAFCDDEPFFGPAHVVIEEIEECDKPTTYQHPMNLSLNKVNRTHSGFNGCYTLPVDIDEKSKYRFLTAIWGDGGWKPSGLDLHGDDICKILKDKAYGQWTDILKSMGLEPQCPIPKGTYCFKNMMVYMENILPSMLYGRIRTDCTLSLKGIQHFTCLRLYTTATPKNDNA